MGGELVCVCEYKLIPSPIQCLCVRAFVCVYKVVPSPMEDSASLSLLKGPLFYQNF